MTKLPFGHLRTAYECWAQIAYSTIKNRDPKYLDYYTSLQVADKLYDAAELIISNNKGEVSPQDVFSLISKQKSYALGLSGIFLTSLLNSGAFDELTIQDIEGLSFVGYRMKRGRINIKSNVSKFTGAKAVNGIITNLAHIDLGLGSLAKGGVFINMGTVSLFGDKALGGLFVNNGMVFGSFGDYAKGGVYWNHKKANWMGTNAKNAFFINEGEIYFDLCKAASDVLCINYGKVSSFLGPEAVSGDYINLNEASVIAADANGGLFIDRGKGSRIDPYSKAIIICNEHTKSTERFFVPSKKIIMPERILIDKELSDYLSQINFLVDKKNPYGAQQEIRALSKSLEQYCLEHYQ